MTSVAKEDWTEANRRRLLHAVAEVRSALRSDAGAVAPEQAAHLLGEQSERFALDSLRTAFGLSRFEQSILVLCAGMELESGFAALCAEAQGDPARCYPTFSLALATLPGAHWSALSPAGPLRRWRLVEIGPGSLLTSSPLRIDERVLNYLTGVSHPDERLAGLVIPVRSAEEPPPSHRQLSARLADGWARAAGGSGLPVLQLWGPDVPSQRAIAAAVCSRLGLRLSVLPAHAIPHSPSETESLVRLCEREMVLGAGALLVECDGHDAPDPACDSAVARFVEAAACPLIVTARTPRQVRGRIVVTREVRRPGAAERRALWQSALDGVAEWLNGAVDRAAWHFSLSPATIRTVGAEVSAELAARTIGAAPTEPGRLLWSRCRDHAHPYLDDLAQRLEPVSAWDDLVLPPQQLGALRDIIVHVRQGATVYQSWGFAAKSSRGLGVAALFTGPSGTGKTMAAEVLANTLELDLYRIDLSQVVSKYIGETEKNLARVFDGAEEGGVVLLFDEADALFGKRSEVRDSHDRYANIEVSYLLQRMEAYRGLAILTTNLPTALDPAFLRRLRFIVHFPFPDTASRAEIWRRVFPAATPTEGLDPGKLARLNLAGGHIHNIALQAAFFAADAGEPVRMSHVLRAARSEYAKLERPLTEAEIGGWA